MSQARLLKTSRAFLGHPCGLSAPATRTDPSSFPRASGKRPWLAARPPDSCTLSTARTPPVHATVCIRRGHGILLPSSSMQVLSLSFLLQSSSYPISGSGQRAVLFSLGSRVCQPVIQSRYHGFAQPIETHGMSLIFTLVCIVFPHARLKLNTQFRDGDTTFHVQEHLTQHSP